MLEKSGSAYIIDRVQHDGAYYNIILLLLLSCDSESILRRMRVLCLHVLSEKSMFLFC